MTLLGLSGTKGRASTNQQRDWVTGHADTARCTWLNLLTRLTRSELQRQKLTDVMLWIRHADAEVPSKVCYCRQAQAWLMVLIASCSITARIVSIGPPGMHPYGLLSMRTHSIF